MRIIINTWRPFAAKKSTVGSINLRFKYVTKLFGSNRSDVNSILNPKINVIGAVSQGGINFEMGAGITIEYPEFLLRTDFILFVL